jgi:hypothetical protein
VITPRLLRRALWRGAQWRLLVVWWASLLMPSVIAALPLLAFFDRHLGRWPRASSLLARLDGSAFLELLRLLPENGSADSIRSGLVGALLVLLFSAPFAAGTTVAQAQTDETLNLRQLAAGAAGLYGRMLRTLLCGLLPLLLAGALAAGAFALANRANDKVLSEATADRNWLLASLPAALALFIAHLLLDSARAQFAADSSRRSAVLALWSAARLFLRRPLRMLLIGLAGGALALAPAALLMGLRLQLAQRSALVVALAWLLAQGAQLAVGWGRNTRLFALADLVRADAAYRLSKGQGPAI